MAQIENVMKIEPETKLTLAIVLAMVMLFLCIETIPLKRYTLQLYHNDGYQQVILYDSRFEPWQPTPYVGSVGWQSKFPSTVYKFDILQVDTLNNK